jgi:hypothetical protein
VEPDPPVPLEPVLPPPPPLLLPLDDGDDVPALEPELAAPDDAAPLEPVAVVDVVEVVEVLDVAD